MVALDLRDKSLTPAQVMSAISYRFGGSRLLSMAKGSAGRRTIRWAPPAVAPSGTVAPPIFSPARMAKSRCGPHSSSIFFRPRCTRNKARSDLAKR